MEQRIIARDRIAQVLGQGFSRSVIASSAILAILCLFYVYSLGTQFHKGIFPLVDRVNYYIPFNFYIINEYVDHVVIGVLLVAWLVLSIKRTKIAYAVAAAFATVFAAVAITNYDPALDGVALASLPAIIALEGYNRYSSRKILAERQSKQMMLVVNHISIVGIIIGVIGLVFALISVSSPGDVQFPVRNYAYDVFLLLSSFSPILMLLLITCFPVKMLINFVFSKLKIRQDAPLAEDRMPQITKAIYLSLFVLLSISLAIIPHLPATNVDGKQIGVDTGYYVNWVKALDNAKNVQDFLNQAFVEQRGGDRPVSLFVLFFLQKATGASMFNTVEYAPAILGPMLIFAVYFLTCELTSSDRTSLLAAFLTAVSFQMLIGIYAGFYANWVALIFGYTSFIFLFRFLKKGGMMNLILFGALIATTLFSHIYTWSILAIAAGVFLAVMLKLNYYKNGRRNAALLMIVLLSTVAIDIGRMSTTGASGGVEEDLELAGQLTGPDQFTLRWNNLTYSVNILLGGLFANLIILGLGIYWLFFKSSFDKPISIFITIFLSVGILPFLFGNYTIQARVFYDIPFQIPAAIALVYLAKQSIKIPLSLPIYIWLVSMAIIAVSNLYLIPPSGTPQLPVPPP